MHWGFTAVGGYIRLPGFRFQNKGNNNWGGGQVPQATRNSTPEKDELSQNAVTINNSAYPDIVKKTVIGVVVLKTISCALLYNMYDFMCIVV
jgi:hypothetical protein